MSSYTLPSLPLLDVGVEREELFNTTVFTAVSGKEQRVGWWPNPRFKFRLTYNALRDNVQAPAPFAAYTELGVVTFFLETHKGQFDSFTFTDPVDGTSRTVRLAADSVRFKKLASGFWSAQFDLYSVL